MSSAGEEKLLNPKPLEKKTLKATTPLLNEGERYVITVPTILTLFRFLVVPFFVVLLINPEYPLNLWGATLFILASVTDWLDGYIARAYNAETILGSLLDPLADKVLVTAALVMLAAVPDSMPRVPAWMVVILLSREIVVTGLRSLAAVQGTVVKASYWAKHKTAWTMVAIVFLLVRDPFFLFGYEIMPFTIGMFGLWIALGLSIFTGIAYAVQLRRMFYSAAD